MDSQTKTAIKTLVLDLRHTLEAELEIVLKRYGIFTDRTWSLEEPPERLADPAERRAWERIVAVVRQHVKEGRTLQQASQDYIRESAFTFLNRLAGLKCLEVRGIIEEVITIRDIYGGRSKQHRDFREEHPRAAHHPDDSLPASIAQACQQVNDELIGYLFDPDDDYSLVWPRYTVLKVCIEKINNLDETVWKEDEIIGWIYQFYNAEEKVAIRKHGKPQTPHDVAVINQFFTPRWVVKFLVDNTLGRLWLEMHPESSRVREKCDYLVPEPLSKEIEAEGDNHKFHIDPDSPINNSQAEPRREPKPVTELKLLDPACGTMHFGYYAMEVFDAIYRDARDWGDVTIDDERIPSAILENNLFGVDIDRRAVQLAALSLFMKARTMHPRTSVRQVNLVVADATLPNGPVRQKFLESYKGDKVVQSAFTQVLEDLDQVAQVGSLLRVEERLKELLAKAGHASVVKGLDYDHQQDLPGFSPAIHQMGLAELVPDEQKASLTPHLTLREMRDDLRAFTRIVLEEDNVNEQLFITEADKAVRLLDVLIGNYDVVVMNPPFGRGTTKQHKYLKAHYPDSSNNVLCCFVERAIRDFCVSGLTGAILDRTFLLKSSYRKFRRDVILSNSHIVACADLGWGILDDAFVETFMMTLKTSDDNDYNSAFINTTNILSKASFEKKLAKINFSDESTVFWVNQDDFIGFPNSSFAYWVPQSIRDMFRLFPSLDPDVAYSREGIHPTNVDLFCRYHWEVDYREIGKGKKWVKIANGGSFSPYYRNNKQVILYENDGFEIKNYENEAGNKAIVPNQKFYFKTGITYGKRTDFLNVQLLDSEQIFTHEGLGVFPHKLSDTWLLISILNSKLMRSAINSLCGQHKLSGYVGLLPYSNPVPKVRELLNNHANWIYEVKRAWDFGNEISTNFIMPWLLQFMMPDSNGFSTGLGELQKMLGDFALIKHINTSPSILEEALSIIINIESAINSQLQYLQEIIDEAVFNLYKITTSDRALINLELEKQPPLLIWPQMENKSEQEKQCEHVRRLFSYFSLQTIRSDPDGVVPLTGGSGKDAYLVDRIRSKLEELLGPEIAYQFEQESPKYLGRTLEEWLQRYFFHQFHVKLYRNRPILWHLTSPKGYFAVFLDYHRISRDMLPKVQSLYLWPQMETVRTRLNAALQNDAPAKLLADLEDELTDLKVCDERLSLVIEGAVKVELPEWANGPYRGGKPPYDPDLDDGVRVNLLPLQEAGLLPVKKVV